MGALDDGGDPRGGGGEGVDIGGVYGAEGGPGVGPKGGSGPEGGCGPEGGSDSVDANGVGVGGIGPDGGGPEGGGGTIERKSLIDFPRFSDFTCDRE